MQVFTKTRVDSNPRFQIPILCPVYSLDSKIQAGQKIEKWKSRARLGIYLGRSPVHARSVALVLNLETGRVSPQFHVQFDPSFSSVMPGSGNSVPRSTWQAAAGLVSSQSSFKLMDRTTHHTEEVFIGDSDTPAAMDEGEPEDHTQESTMLDTSDPTTTENKGANDEPTLSSANSENEGARRSSRGNKGKASIRFQDELSGLGSAEASDATSNPPIE